MTRPSRLQEARLYLVAPARIAAGGLAELIPELAHAGVDIVQLREKEMEAGDLLKVGAPIRDACRSAGIPFIVNDRPDVTMVLDADGVHVGQNDLPVAFTRALVGERIVGVSTHAPGEVDAAVAQSELLDYIAVGPVNETPTKPGRPGTGLPLVSHASNAITLPWYVTGGMAPDTLEPVLEAGARRIVVVRAITEAADPPAVAARLAKMLAAAE